MVSLLSEPPSNEAIYRSAPMTLVQFYLTLELARDVVYVLGNIGDVHFRDLNSKLTPFQRTFVTDLRKIDTVEQQLQFLHETMEMYDTMKVDPFGQFATSAQSFPTNSDIDAVKATINEVHGKIHHLHGSYRSLEVQRLRAIENRYVLNAVNQFYSSGRTELEATTLFDQDLGDNVALLNSRNNSLEAGRHSLEMVEADLEESNVNSISGSITLEKIPLLRKILWRTLRGNLYFHDSPIDFAPDEKAAARDGDEPEMQKSVFIIFIHGDFLKLRVKRIIESLDGQIYDNVNGSASARRDTLQHLNAKIEDLKNVVMSTKDQLILELMVFQDSFAHCYYCIKREKLIYEVLNKFDMDSTRRCLVGEGWIPSLDLSQIRQALKSLIRRKTRGGDVAEGILASTPDSASHSVFQLNADDTFDGEDDSDTSLIAVVNVLTTNRTPPTFHRTNKFTEAFQLIIDAYGIATYQEINPGLATIITFPFMFAIMFGDVGHGFIVFVISLYLIANERKFSSMRNKDEIFDMAFSGRYIILLMGFFSMYTGFIYNDIFSKSMSLFSSAWKWDFPEDYKIGMTLVAKPILGKTYWFGLDWAWHGTENNLLFTNSYKMKLSIIMGYIHMNYSLMFSLINYRFFNSAVDIIGNFIPGFLFMQSIFGYLTLTIIYKWTVDWLHIEKQPPGLLNMLINMFLSPGSIEDQLYPGQKYVQIFLVLIALCCVPWLLIYKPWVLKRQNDKAVNLGYTDLHSQMHHTLQLHEEEQALTAMDHNYAPPGAHSDDELDTLDDNFRFPNDIEPLNVTAHGGDHDEFNFGDIVIHQVIHTIEFCLNCVSHTASYLRLWALSLAHAQLSSVLWTMTIQNAFGTTGAVGIVTTVCLFGLWFTLSVCILVLMEGTSAMLHSLRLHWVEAMSKFFMGEGYAYEPFSFSKIDI
jgi:V-type H+-transporting ATPase subunit a